MERVVGTGADGRAALKACCAVHQLPLRRMSHSRPAFFPAPRSEEVDRLVERIKGGKAQPNGEAQPTQAEQ